MLRELNTTIAYGSAIWNHLRTSQYDYSKTTKLLSLLSIAENTILSITNSIIIRNRINSIHITTHPFSNLIEFYSAPIPSYRVSSTSVKHQILEYQKNPDIFKPYYWNNFFAPLFCLGSMTDTDTEDMQDEVEEASISSSRRSVTSTSKTRSESFTVNDTGIKKLSELVVAQLNYDKDRQREAEGVDIPKIGFISASDTAHAPMTQEDNILWKYRLTLYRRRNASAHTLSMLDLFKSFSYELFYKDKQATILPLASEHSTFTHITSPKQVQAMDLSRMKIYFRPWAKNQSKSLSGEFFIQSVIHPDNFRDALTMGEWLVAHEYEARLSISQNEEMRVIGCLLYSNHFINRDLLTTAIMDDKEWNPEDEDDYGKFHISLRNFSSDSKETSIRILFVSAEVSRMEKMTNFFSSLYDGSAKRYPYCTPFLFIPLYKCNLSSEFRSQLIRMHQDRIGEQVTAITIKGWRSLSSPILVQAPDGSTLPSTVKELLLSLPASQGMVTPYLFTNIEPQANSDFFLAVYASANEALLEERLKSLSKDIHTLLAPGEITKFFIDPLRGLTFGKDIRQYTIGNQASQITSPSSAMQLQRLNQLVRSPPTKRSSPRETLRSTRSKPDEFSSRATATTTSYSGVTQMNRTSFSSPTTSFSSSTATHEYSITIERRFVSIETTLQQQQQQQDQMNIKLDTLDQTSTESNALLKQMMEDMKINSTNRGSKRDKPSGEEDGTQDANMGIQKIHP